MSAQWFILKDSNGNLRQVVTADGTSPSQNGEDMTGMVSYPMQRSGNLDLETPNLTAGTWSPNLPVLKTKLCGMIDATRELKQMVYLTVGAAKKMVYSQKASEVASYEVTSVGAMSDADLRTAYPAAMAEVDATGSTLAQVIARFSAGATAANTAVYKIEAAAQAAKVAINAATTSTAANAAYSAVSWP